MNREGGVGMLALVAVSLWWTLNGVTFAHAGRESVSPDDSALTICFAGDLMLDRGVRAVIKQEGIDRLFSSISSVFQGADFTVANLECPVTNDLQPLNKKYIFRAEPQWLSAVRAAGITHVSLANNHSNDQGRDGIRATADHAATHGVGVLGFGHTAEEARRPTLIVKGNDTVAVFASVFVPLENWMFRADLPGPSQATASELAEDIAVWKSRHPGGIAIGFLHWGWEYQTRPNEQQRVDATRLIRAGADAVIGHHPHVVQTVEQIDGKPVFYSLGNFVFDNSRVPARNGLVVKCTVARGRLTDVQLIPFTITRCAPVPVGNGVIEWFDTYVHPSSPDISLVQRGRDWFLKSSSTALHESHP